MRQNVSIEALRLLGLQDCVSYGLRPDNFVEFFDEDFGSKP